jgi:hypothetical protein
MSRMCGNGRNVKNIFYMNLFLEVANFNFVKRCGERIWSDYLQNVFEGAYYEFIFEEIE